MNKQYEITLYLTTSHHGLTFGQEPKDICEQEAKEAVQKIKNVLLVEGYSRDRFFIEMREAKE